MSIPVGKRHECWNCIEKVSPYADWRTMDYPTEVGPMCVICSTPLYVDDAISAEYPEAL